MYARVWSIQHSHLLKPLITKLYIVHVRYIRLLFIYDHFTGLPFTLIQSTLSYFVGHVSQFQLSQSHGRDRLLETAQFDSVTISCAAHSGHWLFLSFFLLFLKCKTIPVNRRMENLPRVKLDQLQWRRWPCWRRFMQGWAIAFLFLQLFPNQSTNQSINQSINQSMDQSNHH